MPDNLKSKLMTVFGKCWAIVNTFALLIAILLNGVLVLIPLVFPSFLPETAVSAKINEYWVFIQVFILIVSFVIAVALLGAMHFSPILRKLIPGENAVIQIETLNKHMNDGGVKELNASLEKCKNITESLSKVETFYKTKYQGIFFQHIPDSDSLITTIREAREKLNDNIKENPFPEMYLTNFSKTLENDSLHRHEVALCCNYPKVKVYKIITLSTPKKFRTYYDMLWGKDGANKKLWGEDGHESEGVRNLHIACLYASEVVSSRTELPRVIGGHAIGKDKIILLDPKTAVFEKGVAIQIESTLVADTFKSYLKQLWENVAHKTAKRKIGVILYDLETYEHYNWEIWKEVAEKNRDNEELAEYRHEWEEIIRNIDRNPDHSPHSPLSPSPVPQGR